MKKLELNLLLSPMTEQLCRVLYWGQGLLPLLLPRRKSPQTNRAQQQLPEQRSAIHVRIINNWLEFGIVSWMQIFSWADAKVWVLFHPLLLLLRGVIINLCALDPSASSSNLAQGSS